MDTVREKKRSNSFLQEDLNHCPAAAGGKQAIISRDIKVVPLLSQWATFDELRARDTRPFVGPFAWAKIFRRKTVYALAYDPFTLYDECRHKWAFQFRSDILLWDILTAFIPCHFRKTRKTSLRIHSSRLYNGSRNGS